MQGTIINILKIFTIIGILISAFIIIFFILDLNSLENLKEIFFKVLKIIGTLTLTSIVVIFVLEINKTNLLKK